MSLGDTIHKVGVFISKPGKSINSKNPQDFMFNSDRSFVSVKERITLKTTQSTTDAPTPFVFNDIISAVAQYRHGYGYIPESIAFVTTAATRQGGSQTPGNTYINVPSTWQSGDDIIGGQHFELFDCYADDENIYVTASRYTLVSGIGLYNVAANYTFDILLLMEEAK